MKKYGLENISIADYRAIGMVDLCDDMIRDFEDSQAIVGASKQHVQALLDTLVMSRNVFAKRAGVNPKVLKRFKRSVK